jgi:ParB family transcriptional regulator, chromosome partitioning protein
MNRRGGLGRGLAALIPPATGDTDSVGGPEDPAATPGDEGSPDPPVRSENAAPAERATAADGAVAIPASAATLAEVPLDAIAPNPRQPREVFDPEELEGLAASLRDMGLLQPLVVRPLGADRYELIAGERRLRAARLAGLATVPVMVRHTEDADLLKEALVENIHRVQLNPLEEAAAYQQLLEDFGVTQEELASRLGRSRPAISNALRLLGLPPVVKRRVAAGVLSAGHAKALLAIDDPVLLARVADRIVAEGLSVRATEELVRLRLLDGEAPARPRRRSTIAAPGLVELQDDLSDALQTRVRITMGARRGRLTIDFGSGDDLERLVAVIANGLERGAGAQPAIDAAAEGDRG